MKKGIIKVAFLLVLPLGTIIGLLLFNWQYPSEGALKASRENIVSYHSINQNNNHLISYSYISDAEYPVEKGEDISRRTNNAQFFKLGEKDGKETWQAKFYCGEPFRKQTDGKWYAVQTATTTPDVFFNSHKSLTGKLMSMFIGDAFATTTSYYGGAGDGEVQYQSSGISGSDWNTGHDATNGTTFNYTDAHSESYYHPGQWGNNSIFQIVRSFHPVNTSALGTGAIISSAAFYLYIFDHYSASVPGGAPMYFRLVQTTQNDPTLLTVGDYSKCGATDNPTALAPDLANASVNDNQYNTWALNASGLAAINKTGWTKLGVRYGGDVQDYPYQPFWVTRLLAHTSEAGAGTGPYLSVTYTLANTPTVTTPTATSITAVGATLGAHVTSDGGDAITARGTCWGISASPSSNCIVEGNASTGIFSHSRTGLPSGTLIYYRGYATNGVGTGYSPDGTFTTSSPTPASVNWNNGNTQEITLTTVRNFTFSNGQSGGVYSLLIKQDATGGWGVTWPANVKWPGGTLPTLTATANGFDIIKFVYDGSNYAATGITLDIK